MRDLRLTKEIDDAAVWVLLADIAIFEPDHEVAIGVLFTADTGWEQGYRFVGVLRNNPAILLPGTLDRFRLWPLRCGTVVLVLEQHTEFLSSFSGLLSFLLLEELSSCFLHVRFHRCGEKALISLALVLILARV